MNVLICDDDLKIVQQIKNFLLKLSKQSTYNFDITCFSNGDSILDKQIKTDFAFIDIEMPGVNGLTVTKHLQKINPNIIIFIVTSFQGYLDDAMDLNVFRFLSKPIDENRFFRSMKIALNLYKHNDDTIRAIKLISSIMANAVLEGKQGEQMEDAAKDESAE